MKKIFFISFTLLFSFFQQAQNQEKKFTVMAWNILHGGNDIENGPENVARIIKEINPDIILMVETYGSGPYIAKQNGYNFHLIAKEGTKLDDKNINLSIFFQVSVWGKN